MSAAVSTSLDAPSPQAALRWLLVATMMAGAGMLAPKGNPAALLALVSKLVLGFLPFLWYCRDSNARAFKRTIWWNMGMVALLFPTILIYLWRSRARGRRLRAIGRAAGYGALLVLAAVIGMGLAWLCVTLAQLF
ncbi:MAG TPA: hypothetical protein VFU95_02150 [Telluria sp.]|nr:hypothetical protein [Telluria sp.]